MTEAKPNTLFISRAHPPVLGGIENQNEAIGRWLSQRVDCHIIANHRGKRWLPIFLPLAVIKGIWYARKVDAVLLGDGVVSIVGWFIRIFYPRKRIVCILHGLDITYSSVIYQRLWVRFFFRAANHFIAVSQSTADIARRLADVEGKVSVIPNGIDMPEDEEAYKRRDLSTLIGQSAQNRPVLVTVGRLVKRKGVAWFLENVLPGLPEGYLYVIAGDGPEREAIISLINEPENSGRVIYLGRISEDDKQLLFITADLFVQPNIKVEGDAEGFGITLIEAGSYGLPVLASDIEGLKDSVSEDMNGWRVPPGDAKAFSEKIIHKINEMGKNSDINNQVKKYVGATFSYPMIIEKYIKVLANDN